MMRLNFILMLAVIASAIFLVRSQYDSHRLFTELERVNGEAHRLDVENERLQVERREQATPSRVEKLAREDLHMRMATPGITQYVGYKSAASAAAPQKPAASVVKQPSEQRVAP